MKTMRKGGFTLVEILIVLVILMILAALLFPVFSSVRAKARQTACASNLRQIGLAVIMYTQDYDDLFPRGGDPTDINTDAWRNAFEGRFSEDAKALRPLPVVMHSYIKKPEIWQCPSDSGFDLSDTGSQTPLNARPTSYEAFGSSYYYRTELTLRRRKNIIGFDPVAPHAQRGPSDINVLFDGAGTWHGEEAFDDRRYNVLMADGRVKHMTMVQFRTAWGLRLEKPRTAPPTK